MFFATKCEDYLFFYLLLSHNILVLMGFLMIHALLIMDQSGTLVYSWKNPEAPKDILGKFEPELVGSFITALLNFGAEVFRAPRYLDVGVAGLSFFSVRIGKHLLLFTVIADKTDHSKAVLRFVKDFKERAGKLLSVALSYSEAGLVVITKELADALNEIVNKVINKHMRALPDVRSDDKRAFIWFLPLSIVVSTFLMFLWAWIIHAVILAELPSQMLYLMVIFLWSVLSIIIGILCGVIANRGKAGFGLAVISYIIGWVLYVFLVIGGDPFLMLTGMIYLPIAGGMGYLLGKLLDQRKLTLVKG